MEKYRAVIYTKTIIVEEDARAFHKIIAEAADEVEEAGQRYGWAQSVIAEEDEEKLPTFTIAFDPYGPGTY